MKITYARALRIQDKLLKAERFANNLGEKTLKLERKDGVITDFHCKVEAIAVELTNRGLDANICKTEELYAAADFVLAGNASSPVAEVDDYAGTANDDDVHAATVACTPAAEAPPPVAAPVRAAAQPAKADKPSIEVKWTLPIYSLLVSAQAIAERDKSPKSAARKGRLDALVAEYYAEVSG